MERNYFFIIDEINWETILLYAKTDEEITPDHHYSMDGNKISVKTLDLAWFR